MRLSPPEFAQCKIWDAASGKLHKTLPAQGAIRNLAPDDAASHRTQGLPTELSASFCPVGTRLLATVFLGTATIWDVETGDKLFVLGDVGKARDIAFSPDGKSLLTVWDDGGMKVWDPHAGGTELLPLGEHKNIIGHTTFSPCGRYFASRSRAQGASVRLWRTRDGSHVVTCSEHHRGRDENWVTCVVFSPNGKILSSGGSDGEVIIRRMRDIVQENEQDT